MGCCGSTPREPTITPAFQPSTLQAARAPSQFPASSRQTFTGQPLPPAQVFNAPLKPHFWSPKGTERQWRQSALDLERQTFWDTAITNRAEIWASLHLVCDELVTISAATAKLWERVKDDTPVTNSQEAEELPGVQDMKERVRNAQAIIDAAGITLPTGDLVDGAYDEVGNHYTMPVWVVCNPENLRPDDETSGGMDMGDGMGLRAVDETRDDDFAMLGKGGAEIREVETPVVENITVKCRLTDGRQDIVVKVPKDAKVGVLAKKVADAAEAKIRLAYLGKMLDPTEPLIDQGWQEGNVVSAMVFPLIKLAPMRGYNRP